MEGRRKRQEHKRITYILPRLISAVLRSASMESRNRRRKQHPWRRCFGATSCTSSILGIFHGSRNLSRVCRSGQERLLYYGQTYKSLPNLRSGFQKNWAWKRVSELLMIEKRKIDLTYGDHGLQIPVSSPSVLLTLYLFPSPPSTSLANRSYVHSPPQTSLRIHRRSPANSSFGL